MLHISHPRSEGASPETILTMERGVVSRDCGANRSAGGGSTRVPGRKSPRRSAERASRLQRDGPRFAHAVVAPRTRDITEECACRRSATPSFRGGCEQKGRTPTHKRRAGTRRTARCDVARLPAPPHPEEARRAVSK